MPTTKTVEEAWELFERTLIEWSTQMDALEQGRLQEPEQREALRRLGEAVRQGLQQIEAMEAAFEEKAPQRPQK